MCNNAINYILKIDKNHSINYILDNCLFTNDGGLSSINGVVAKSTTEPRNSNINTLANNSTPLKRAFFVCSLHTPKEKVNSLLLSMVAWNGKGLALCYDPVFIVFETVSRYRQLLASKLNAVTFKNSTNHTGAKQ